MGRLTAFVFSEGSENRKSYSVALFSSTKGILVQIFTFFIKQSET